MGFEFKSKFQDSFRSLLTGLGVPGRDRAVSMSPSADTITYSMRDLENLYRGNWIAKKIVDIPAFDCTRSWRTWDGEQDDIQKMEDAEKSFGLQRKMLDAMIKSRLYGGAAMVMGVKGQKFNEELDLESIKEGDLKFVHVVEKWMIQAGPRVRDITSPWFGEPSHYMRSNTPIVPAPGGVTPLEASSLGYDPGDTIFIHPSRVVRMVGIEYPDLEHSPDAWGDSVLAAVYEAIRDAGLVTQSLANMIADAKVDVFKIPGLTSTLSTQAGTDKMISYFANANVAKSVVNSLVIDKEIDWERIQTKFEGLPEVLQAYLMICSAGADIPSTRMLSREPSGQNATGESDTRNYYDRLSSEQAVILTPTLSRLDEVLIRSTLGDRPKELKYDWNPLWQMTDTEKADIALKKAQAYQIDVNTALIPAQALVVGRQNQLIEDGVYPGLETALDDLDQNWNEEAEFLPLQAMENSNEQQEASRGSAEKIAANAPPPVIAPAAPSAAGPSAAKKPTGDHMFRDARNRLRVIKESMYDDEGSKRVRPFGRKTEPDRDGNPNEGLPLEGHENDIFEEGVVQDAYDPDEERDESGRWGSGSFAAASKFMFGKNSKFEQINNALRGKEKISPAIQKIIEEVDADFKSNGKPIQIGTKLYRGLAFDEGDPILSRISSGKSFMDLGYTSTTSDKQWAEKGLKGDIGQVDVMLHITPSATKNPVALYNPKEKEYLFQRNSYFSVTSITKSDGRIDAYVTLTRVGIKDGFDPDEERDDHGRFGSGSSGSSKPDILVYHGTARSLVSSIKTHGLIPSGEQEKILGEKSKGGDAWAKTKNMSVHKFSVGSRAASVYITNEGQTAITFAKIASKMNNSEPVILKIKIPADRVGDIFEDEFAPDMRAYRFKGHITPDMIETVHVKDKPPIPLHEFEDAVGDIVLYGVIFTKAHPTEDADWDEGKHPRGGATNPGQFAAGGGGSTSSKIASREAQSNAVDAVVTHLRMTAPMSKKDDFILRNGTAYMANEKTYAGKRDPIGLCYMNATKDALYKADRTYVEGYITVHNVPVQHAWTVDSKGQIYDTTIRPDEKVSGYFGVPFAKDYLANAMQKNGYYGLLGHESRKTIGPLLSGKAKNFKAIADPDKLDDDVIADRLSFADRLLSSIPPTDGLHSADRLEMRDKIVETLYNQNMSKRTHDRTATIVLGLPGSGKSTLSVPLVKAGRLEIEGDNAKAMLPEFAGGVGAYAVHEESSAIMRRVLAKAMVAGDDIVWPRIDSADKIVKDIQSLHDAGYTVNVKFADVPVPVAVHSAITRFLKMGRYVSPEMITRYGDSPRASYNAAISTGLLASHERFKRGPNKGFVKVE